MIIGAKNGCQSLPDYNLFWRERGEEKERNKREKEGGKALILKILTLMFASEKSEKQLISAKFNG